MNGKAKFALKNFLFLGVLAILLFLSFVLAAHVITLSDGTTSANLDEDIGFIYNITVNITADSQSGNVTIVNITLPTGFLFIPGTENGTDADGAFTNTSNELVWTNSTPYLINGTPAGTLNNFWFNATAATPGYHNITVQTTNSTGIYWANISIKVNDTTVPSAVAFVAPTNVTGTNLTISTINYNITASDNGVLDKIIVHLYNNNSIEINNATSTSSPLSGSFTELANGIYLINASANDTYGNVNWTTDTRTINISDVTAPSVSLSSSSSTTTTLIITITRSDASGISSCSTTSGGKSPSISGTTLSDSGLSCGTSYSYIVTCDDYAGNSGSSASTSFSTNSCGGGGSPATTTGGTTWTNTFVESDVELSEKEGRAVTKQLGSKHRVKLKVSGETHYVGVTSLTASTATIEVSSTPQEAILQVGDERKFDVDEDGSYYDLLVKLNSIESNKADLTIRAISELITEETIEEETQQEEEAAGVAAGEEEIRALEGIGVGTWIIILVVIIIIAGVVFYFIKIKK